MTKLLCCDVIRYIIVKSKFVAVAIACYNQFFSKYICIHIEAPIVTYAVNFYQFNQCNTCKIIVITKSLIRK